MRTGTKDTSYQALNLVIQTAVWKQIRLLGAAPNTPIQERILTMHEFLFFMIGFLLGGVIGVTIMCLMQINRIHGGSNARKEDEEL